MVFGPFAETKGPRRAGAKPRMVVTELLLSGSGRGKSHDVFQASHEGRVYIFLVIRCQNH